MRVAPDHSRITRHGGPGTAQLFADAVELGGSISGEHGLGALNRQVGEPLEGAPKSAIETPQSLANLGS